MPLHFVIDPSKGLISDTFCELGIVNFQQAADWVNRVPYRRNHKRDNMLALFEEQCGTCSTKHALLKRLADENGYTRLRLVLGLFKMNAINTPAIKHILQRYNLEYLPEGHNYLKIRAQMLDYTVIDVDTTSFAQELLEEIDINPDQITAFKTAYHRSYLKQWAKESQLSYSVEKLWQIREECIRAIALSRQEIYTERLFLRPFRKEDGAIMYALNEDREVLQYTGDSQFADVETAERFLEKYDQYEKYGVGRMTTILRESGEILGWFGLKYHPDTDEFDIGYRFFKQHWGQGYATESADAVMTTNAQRLAIKRIVGRARVENTASIKVFYKLAMQYVKSFEENGEKWVLFEKRYD